MDIDLTSKDYARIIYHTDKSMTKTKEFKYKEKYESLVKVIEMAGLKIDSVYTKVHEKEMEDQDEKLRWKLQFLQEAKHQEELDEALEEDE